MVLHTNEMHCPEVLVLVVAFVAFGPATVVLVVTVVVLVVVDVEVYGHSEHALQNH
jgi:hypothetical protein